MKRSGACKQVYYPLEQTLGYLNDLHPYEVATMSTDKRRCDSLDVRRKRAITCADGKEAMRMPGCQPPRPAAFVYDGRLVNQLTERRFLADPCRHWRNVYPWKPQKPKIVVPPNGHYNGLGKPPRQCFRLREMRILGNRTMPAFELLSREDIATQV